jgi:DNA-binding CsgD family transcriptional regulator
MNDPKNYFKVLKQLLETLQVDELLLNDLCRILVMQTFKHNGATEAFLFESHPDATYSLTAAYGVPPNFENGKENIPLSSTYPSSECIRTNSIITTTSERLGIDFPDSAKLTDQRSFDHLTVFPLRKFGMPIGAFAILSENEMDLETSADFLELVALLVSARFSDNGRYKEISYERARFPNKSKALTERESLIQVGMSNGLTNVQIAVELGFSESTIRQDAVSLFGKLGVTNRRDAGKLVS